MRSAVIESDFNEISRIKVGDDKRKKNFSKIKNVLNKKSNSLSKAQVNNNDRSSPYYEYCKNKRNGNLDKQHNQNYLNINYLKNNYCFNENEFSDLNMHNEGSNAFEIISTDIYESNNYF